MGFKLFDQPPNLMRHTIEIHFQTNQPNPYDVIWTCRLKKFLKIQKFLQNDKTILPERLDATDFFLKLWSEIKERIFKEKYENFSKSSKMTMNRNFDDHPEISENSLKIGMVRIH